MVATVSRVSSDLPEVDTRGRRAALPIVGPSSQQSLSVRRGSTRTSAHRRWPAARIDRCRRLCYRNNRMHTPGQSEPLSAEQATAGSSTRCHPTARIHRRFCSGPHLRARAHRRIRNSRWCNRDLGIGHEARYLAGSWRRPSDSWMLGRRSAAREPVEQDLGTCRKGCSARLSRMRLNLAPSFT
jgi:hypothetical protein